MAYWNLISARIAQSLCEGRYELRRNRLIEQRRVMPVPPRARVSLGGWIGLGLGHRYDSRSGLGPVRRRAALAIPARPSAAPPMIPADTTGRAT